MSNPQWVTIGRRRLHFRLEDGRTVMCIGGTIRPLGAVTVNRLQLVSDDAEGISDDGQVLNVNARGVLALVDHLETLSTFATSRTKLKDHALLLLSGGPDCREMWNAAMRAAGHLPAEGGESTYWLDVAKRQLADR